MYVEYILIDEWLVGLKLYNLNVEEVVVMLLIIIIVWEVLFDCLIIIENDKGKLILIINGVGGVGFIVI